MKKLFGIVKMVGGVKLITNSNGLSRLPSVFSVAMDYVSW
jgi:hypothetical protein